MGYVEGHLLPGEKVVYHAHLHWILFAWPVAVAVLAIPLLFLQPLVGAIVTLAAIGLAVPPLRTRRETGVSPTAHGDIFPPSPRM